VNQDLTVKLRSLEDQIRDYMDEKNKEIESMRLKPHDTKEKKVKMVSDIQSLIH